MSVPRLPSFDAKTFAQRLYERVRKPNGDPYTVFDPVDDGGHPIGFPRFVEGLRTQRDVLAAHDVQLQDHKHDIDSMQADVDDLDKRVAVLEGQQATPFPGSG